MTKAQKKSAQMIASVQSIFPSAIQRQPASAPKVIASTPQASALPRRTLPSRIRPLSGTH
jgi:hypothetical protein